MAKKIRLYEVTSLNGHGKKDTNIHPAPSKEILQDILTTEDVRVEVKFIGWGNVTACPSDYNEPIFQIENEHIQIDVHGNQVGYGYLKQQCPAQFKAIEKYLNNRDEFN